MKVEFSRTSLKFFEKLTSKDKETIKGKLNFLINFIEESGMIPYKELDIKKLSGEWYPLKRMRIGKIRIIFEINKEENILKIFKIDFRGEIYQ